MKIVEDNRRLVAIVVMALSLLPTAFCANVSLTASDLLGETSFNSSLHWSNLAAPAPTNHYFTTNFILRTPPSASSYTFGGASLTVNNNNGYSQGLLFKGVGSSGTIIINNLILAGGFISHASSIADTFRLAGSLTVATNSTIYAKQGPVILVAPVGGSATLTNLLADSQSGTLSFSNAANTFTGTIVNNGYFTLLAGANLNFVIGANGVNNRFISPPNSSALFRGRFVFDLTAASTNLGSVWTVGANVNQGYGSTFSVDGFARVAGGTGAGVWQRAANGAFYSFDTASGTLHVVSSLSTNTNSTAILNAHVAFLRDSVVATNACLMPDGATYGRAINGISFQDQILTTFNGYQYTAWYDTGGTTQSLWLARRAVTNTSVGAWEKFQTDSELLNGDENAWDAHNVIAFGICPGDGTLHLAWDLHGQRLKYRRSIPGLCTTNQAVWGAGMLGPLTTNLAPAEANTYDASVTYPQFLATPDNKLILNRRYQDSGNGDCLFQTYDPATGDWSPNTLFISRVGTYSSSTSRNAYLNGLDFGPDGKLHVTWTWREGAGSANHDLCYAYSADNGVTWRNNAGTVVADTSLGQSMNLNTPGIIFQPVATTDLLINQQAQCVDNDSRLHVLVLHRRTDSGYEYPNYTTANFSTLATAYYHYVRDPATGTWARNRIPPDSYPVGSRPKIGYDANGNVYSTFLSYPAGSATVPGYISGNLVIACATKAAQYTNWAVVQAFTNTFDGEPLIDQARLLADNILSVYIQENSPTTTVVGTPLHVFDLAVNITQPNPVALDFSGVDSLVTIASETGHSYQLRSTPMLSPASWVTNVAPVQGTGGLLALPDAGGRTNRQRFYNVIGAP